MQALGKKHTNVEEKELKEEIALQPGPEVAEIPLLQTQIGAGVDKTEAERTRELVDIAVTPQIPNETGSIGDALRKRVERTKTE